MTNILKTKTLEKTVEIHEVLENEIVHTFSTIVPSSGAAKHIVARHNRIIYKKQLLRFSDKEQQVVQMIFSSQGGNIMDDIKAHDFCSLPSCCQRTLESLGKNLQELCKNTKIFYAIWRRERQLRITASACHSIARYYSSNRKKDWEKKCYMILYPADVNNQYTEYGKEKEGPARKKFIEQLDPGEEVIETGLIVSTSSTWLAATPDGVVLKNCQPHKLLEIKCPWNGKKMNIEDLVINLRGKGECFDGPLNAQIALNKKHDYYGQVLLGMAILNVKEASFVIYSYVNNGKFFILNVAIDEKYLNPVLKSLKHVYFEKLLPKICFSHDETKENESDNTKS